MREKYIEEQFPRYFIFGKSPIGDKVDVASAKNDTVATVTGTHAEQLIKDRDELLDQLVKMAQAFAEADHEAFRKFWYG